MVKCAVRGCQSRTDVHTKLDNGIHFHRVPKNQEIREKWKQAINKEVIKNGTRVCSEHFRKENYYLTTRGLHKLLVTAIPDINLVLEPVEDVVVSSSDDEEFPEPAGPSIQRNSCNPSPSQKTGNVHAPKKMKTSDQLPKKNIRPKESQSLDNAENRVSTDLEKKLLNEVRKLQSQSKTQLEAISCLEEQNRRLLTRNNYLQQALDKYEKVSKEINKAVFVE